MNIFGDEKAKNEKFFCIMIVTDWGIQNIIEIFPLEFENNLIEHDFVIFSGVDSFGNEDGDAVILFF